MNYIPYFWFELLDLVRHLHGGRCPHLTFPLWNAFHSSWNTYVHVNLFKTHHKMLKVVSLEAYRKHSNVEYMNLTAWSRMYTQNGLVLALSCNHTLTNWLLLHVLIFILKMRQISSIFLEVRTPNFVDCKVKCGIKIVY